MLAKYKIFYSAKTNKKYEYWLIMKFFIQPKRIK